MSMVGVDLPIWGKKFCGCFFGTHSPIHQPREESEYIVESKDQWLHHYDKINHIKSITNVSEILENPRQYV